MSSRTKAYDRLIQMGVRASAEFAAAKDKLERSKNGCSSMEIATYSATIKEKGIYINALSEVAEQVFGRKIDLYMGDLHAAIKKPADQRGLAWEHIR